MNPAATNHNQPFPLRRVLGLGTLSTGLHLAVLVWLGAPAWRVAPLVNAPGSALSVRLVASSAAASPPAAAALPKAIPEPRPAPPLAPSTRPVTKPARPAAAAVPTTAPVADAASDAAGDPLGDPEAGRAPPGRNTARVPPSVVLSFDVSEGPALTPRAAPARLVWQTSPQHYSARFEAVPDAYGGAQHTYTSEGGMNDGGIAPDSALDQQDGGAEIHTRFDREKDRVELASGASMQLGHSTQDIMSMLMQITGMGLAEPDQMQNTLEFEVAGANGRIVLRFDVSGPEQLDTALGMLTVWHLTQQPRPGEPILELWLAPSMSWYPVQLRSSGPAGVIWLQRLRSAAPGGAAP